MNKKITQYRQLMKPLIKRTYWRGLVQGFIVGTLFGIVMGLLTILIP